MKTTLFILLLTISLQAETTSSDIIRFSGGTTIQPIIEKTAPAYQQTNKESLYVEGGGSEVGIQKVINHSSDIAMIARNLSEEEKSRFAYMTIAVDAVAVIHHESQSINNLTKQELIGFYDGSKKECNYAGCEHVNLIIISRKIDRATLATFEAYTGLKSPKRKNLPPDAKLIKADAWEAESNINTLLWVAGLKGSIAIVSHAEAIRYEKMGYPIRITEIENVYPSLETIKNGTYPIQNTLNLVWNKENTKVERFIGWVKSGGMDSDITKLGFVAVDK
ncbi:MAG: substrate-binding domain-containing protein [Campylobacterales bacterium]|nr:substrate-binding domain-containing protein [Campylobacterales bacterium]